MAGEEDLMKQVEELKRKLREVEEEKEEMRRGWEEEENEEMRRGSREARVGGESSERKGRSERTGIYAEGIRCWRVCEQDNGLCSACGTTMYGKQRYETILFSERTSEHPSTNISDGPRQGTSMSASDDAFPQLSRSGVHSKAKYQPRQHHQ